MKNKRLKIKDANGKQNRRLAAVILFFIFYLLFFIPPANASGSVVINEFVYDADGSDEGYEWVELYNNSKADIDITDWKIKRWSTSKDDFEDYISISSGVKTFTIKSHSYFLLAQSKVCAIFGLDAGYPDFNIPDEETLGNTSPQAMRLYGSSTTVMDMVVYGDDESNTITGDDNNVAPKASSGKSLTRDPDGSDSDNNASDFYVNSFPTPRSSKYGSYRYESYCYPAPNPFKPNGANTCTIIAPAELGSLNASIEIYDLSGMLVRKLTGTNKWDGKNQNGDFAASGNYFIVYSALKGRAKGKMTILR